MGYYTFYQLRVRKLNGEQTWTKEEVEELTNVLKERKVWGYAFNNVEFFNSLTFTANNEVKWYEYDEDMLAISKQFPDYVFQLHGDGEETEDFWFAYYQNGKLEYCPAHLIYKEPQEIFWSGDTQYE